MIEIRLGEVPLAEGWSQPLWQKAHVMLLRSPADLSDQDIELLAAWPDCTKQQSDEARADAIRRRDDARAKSVEAPKAPTTTAAIPRRPIIDPEALAEGIVTAIARALETPNKRITQLEHDLRLQTHELESLRQKCLELESRPLSLKYCGVWQRAQEYQRDAAVTHAGSLWMNVLPKGCSTCGVAPGADATVWQLAQKGDTK